MRPNSYSQPPPFSWKPVDVRALLPIYPPPEPLERPILPTPQRNNPFDAPYELSTHLFPACYLRTGRFHPVPPLPAGNLGKEERSKILKKYREELRQERGPMQTDGYPKVLWNCVNRYARKGLQQGKGTGLTVFFAHANGFPKEIWEPTLAKLLTTPASELIDEIWAWESVQHGDAALINSDSLSKFFDWQDNSRDIINFLSNFLPTAPSSAPLPLHLELQPEQESLNRKQKGFRSRRIMVVAHSYGGCTSTLAAENYPNLFDSLVLIDPVIAKPYNTTADFEAAHARTDALLMGSLMRRDTWRSREEALSTFLKNPFFLAWHPSVLNVYVEAGIYDTIDTEGNPAVKLKMPGIYESIVFAERTVSHEAWQGVHCLDERIALRWIVPGRGDAEEFGPPGSTRERVWARPKNSSNIKIEGAGHLIPQERPIELAEDLRAFVLYQYSNLRRGVRVSARSNL